MGRDSCYRSPAQILHFQLVVAGWSDADKNKAALGLSNSERIS